MFDVLGITYKQFISYLPKFIKNDINKDLMWLNIIVFSYLSTYYTTL
jgi:hypothetical protein